MLSLEDADKRLKNSVCNLQVHQRLLPTNPPSNVQLPMTYQQAVVKQKKSKVSDSISWLATLVISQWKRLIQKLL